MQFGDNIVILEPSSLVTLHYKDTLQSWPDIIISEQTDCMAPGEESEEGDTTGGSKEKRAATNCNNELNS